MTEDSLPDPQAPQEPASTTGQNSHSDSSGPVAHHLDYRAAGNGPFDGDAPLRQSARGRASFLIGLFVLLLVPSGVWLVAVTWTRGNTSPYMWLFYGCVVGGPVLSLIGLGLGVACVREKQRKKVLGSIGLILNAGVVAVALFILVFVVMNW